MAHPITNPVRAELAKRVERREAWHRPVSTQADWFSTLRFSIEAVAQQLDPEAYLSYHAPYVAFGWALKRGFISQSLHDRARQVLRASWNYVGD